jgi:hypothetical protein
VKSKKNPLSDLPDLFVQFFSFFPHLRITLSLLPGEGSARFTARLGIPLDGGAGLSAVALGGGCPPLLRLPVPDGVGGVAAAQREG